MSYGQRFKLALFTDDLTLAAEADHAGVDYVGVDLERLGKTERQGHLKDARISDHRALQLPRLRASVARALIFARTNPIHPGSSDEIDRLLDLGAQALLLPMFTTRAQIDQFVRWIDGRARVWLLLETPQAAMRIHAIVQAPGVDLIHVGLNDLHLGLGLHSHFEVLASDLMTVLSDAIRGAGIEFGVGTLARYDDRTLPVPPDLIYPQYPRLKATVAFLSRYFVVRGEGDLDVSREVARCRRRLDEWSLAGQAAWDAARDRLREHVSQVFHGSPAPSGPEVAKSRAPSSRRV